MHSLRFLVLLLMSFAISSWAQMPIVPADTSAQLDSSKTTVFADIDVFGENALGSIFILWDKIDIDADLKKTIQEKSFAANTYFMQNIDREQFEQERLLKLFDDDKQQYYRIFPDSIWIGSEDDEY